MLKKLGITAIAVSTIALTGCQSDFEKKLIPEFVADGFDKEWAECAVGVIDDNAPDEFKDLIIQFGIDSTEAKMFVRVNKNLFNNKDIEATAVEECGKPKRI